MSILPPTEAPLPLEPDNQASHSPRERKTAVALTLALVCIPSLAMYGQRDTDPLRALRGSAYQLASKLGHSACPAAPSELEIDQIKAHIADAQLLSEDELLVENGIKPGELEFFNRTLAPLNSAVSITEKLSVYTEKNLGYETQLDIPADNLSSQLDIAAYKHDVSTFATYASLMSPKLQRAIGIKKLVITNMLEQTNYHLDGAFKPNHIDDYEVQLDINSLRNPATYAHEMMGHGPQYRLCTGLIANDPAVIARNPSQFHYGVGCGHPVESSNVFANYYGQSNLSEDQATSSAQFILDGATADAQLKQKTPLGYKIGINLARWEMLAPNSSIMLTNARPYLKIIEAENNGLPSAYTPIVPRTEGPASTPNCS